MDESGTERHHGWPLINTTQLAIAALGAIATITMNSVMFHGKDSWFLDMFWELSLWPTYALYKVIGIPWRMHPSLAIPWSELVVAACVNAVLLFLVSTVLRMVASLVMKVVKDI